MLNNPEIRFVTEPIVDKVYKFEDVPENEQLPIPNNSVYLFDGQYKTLIFPPNALTFGSQS